MKILPNSDVPRGAIAVCGITSAVLFAFAACAYPGGNHFDHHARGHDFWRNALCDVARTTAIGGAPNAGAGFARIAMSTMALAIGLMLWSLPRHFTARPRLGHVVRGFGVVTVPAALAVVFLPTDRFSAVHGVATLLAGVIGTAGATLAVSASRRRSSIFGVLTLAAAFGSLGIYAVELILGGPPRLAVPVLEHVAALLLLAWMLAFECEDRV